MTRDLGAGPPPGAVASVLVVDDTVDNLHLLSELLGEQGYEVRAVTSGQQALRAALHDPPDLILLDITMPEMDGYEVCRRLHLAEPSRDVPIIFLTAHSGTADKVRAFDAGGVDYITKPFQLAEVLARVRTHVALRRAQQALVDSYQRLRDLEQLRDDLVHMVVHDMRSPLASLLMSLNLLKEPVAALTGESQDDLRQAAESARAVNRMANDLLAVSQLEQNRMPIERAPCDLVQMAGDVRTALRVQDATRPIEIEGPDAATARCDGALVRRVLENLVSNGIRHTPAGSRLRISVASGGGRTRVAVHDDGQGVPPEARQRIFEKFATAGPSRSAGLGLAFCKLAIEAHGGTIGMEPGVPGGSTFWFELPE